MRVYIASNVASRSRLREIREQIRTLGHEVVSSWIDTASDYGDPVLTEERFKWAGAIDLQEINHCTLFIIDTLDESTTGGREVELGYFLFLQELAERFSQGFLLWRVGPIRNLYHVFADRAFDNWLECLEVLKGIQL